MTIPPGLHGEISEDGLFWLPAAPDNQVAGTLTFTQEDGCHLRLLGTLTEVTDLFAAGEPQEGTELIHGLTSTGVPVTILGAFRTQHQMSFPGLVTETHFGNVLGLGLHFSSSTDSLFRRSVVRFDGMENWLGERPFTLDRDVQAKVVKLNVLRSPQASFAAMLDCVVETGSILYTSNRPATEYRLTAHSTMSIKATEPQSLDWHLAGAARLQELASLCTGHYLPLVSLSLEGLKLPGAGRPAEVRIYVRIQHPEAGARPRYEAPIVAGRELAELAPGAVARWFDEYDRLRPAINLFFAVTGSKDMFSSVRFLLCAQALEVFHRMTSEALIVDERSYEALRLALVAAIPPGTQRNMREKIVSMLRFANEPSLNQRLKSMIKALEEEFGERPAGLSKAFFRGVVDTRNYLTHYPAELRDKAFDGADMHWACRRMIMLLTVLFLMRLGIGGADIRRLLKRHEEFSRLWDSADEPS